MDRELAGEKAVLSASIWQKQMDLLRMKNYTPSAALAGLEAMVQSSYNAKRKTLVGPHRVGYSYAFQVKDLPKAARCHFSFWFEYEDLDDICGCVIRLPVGKRDALEATRPFFTKELNLSVRESGKVGLNVCLQHPMHVTFVKSPTQQLWKPVHMDRRTIQRTDRRSQNICARSTDSLWATLE